MTIKEEFLKFVRENCGSPNSGTANSYKTALNKLSSIFSENRPIWCPVVNIWELTDVAQIMTLYENVKLEQDKFKKNMDGLFRPYRGVGDSYFRSGYCSAALRFFAQFQAERVVASKFDEIIASVESGTDVAKKAQKINIDDKVRSLMPDEIDVNTKEGKEIFRQTKQRVNQDQFRKWILKIYSGRCCITGLDIPDVLRASHISPWAEDEKNRLNPENGLCLSATYDAAFDRHLISFDEDYRLVVSKEIKEHYTSAVAKEYFLNRVGQQLYTPVKFFPSKELLAKHRELLA